MKKVIGIGVVVVIVAVVYVLMSIFMPLVSDIAGDTVTRMAAEHDMAQYPGTTSAMSSSPWLLYFVPGAAGIFAIILILRAKDDE